MNLNIRLETPADYRVVEYLTREAFWGMSRPTCDEHYLVHLLRDSTAFVPKLNFVAEIPKADSKSKDPFLCTESGVIIGNVMYSKSKIIAKDGLETEILTFGPLSVLPEYWDKGVGSKLMRHSIAEAKRLGYRAIAFYGHPDYYPRFGFQNAAAFGITTSDGKNFDALMAMELYDGALDGISGVFHEDEVFVLCGKETPEQKAYFAGFPFKEPACMIPIDVLLDRLEPAAVQAFTSRDYKTLSRIDQSSGREMLRWEGIDEQVMKIVNEALIEYGYSPKLAPSSHILQLATMGLQIPIVDKIRSKAGVYVYRVESEGEKYILKTFDNHEDTREINNYKMLSELGIPTLPLLKHTKTALLLPDVNASTKYRLGIEEDLSDPAVARAIARWYKILHEKGRKYLCAHNVNLYSELDTATPQNMEQIAQKSGTQDNPFWKVFKDNFTKIRQKVDALPYTLVYNDFYWTNLIVAKDGESAMMFDYNLLGKGCVCSDVNNVTSSLKDSAKQAFLDEYGDISITAEEVAADSVLSPLHCLYYHLDKLPLWAEDELNKVKSRELLSNLLKWMEG